MSSSVLSDLIIEATVVIRTRPTPFADTQTQGCCAETQLAATQVLPQTALQTGAEDDDALFWRDVQLCQTQTQLADQAAAPDHRRSRKAVADAPAMLKMSAPSASGKRT